ncbi:MAG: DUF402 domain-containing protein [Lachnospiraceae bacterium]|nr:DUF402 domain-containing protein [Lachnospiraceae bacterium]
MKRCRLSYDEWKCILSKEMTGKRVVGDFFEGYIGLIDIRQVSEVQKWKLGGEEIVVCDGGIKWLSILPQNDFYCITAMMNEKSDILLWYIDMIAGQGTDTDGMPWFDDLYLDLVVYPNGEIKVDDMDELEEALRQKDITQEQFDLALHTADQLKKGLLKDIHSFKDYTYACYELLCKD